MIGRVKRNVVLNGTTHHTHMTYIYEHTVCNNFSLPIDKKVGPELTQGHIEKNGGEPDNSGDDMAGSETKI